MSPFRPSVRLRLTALYGALFLAAGVVLLALNYVLVRRNLPLQVEFRGPSPAIGELQQPLVVPAPEDEVRRLEAAAVDFR